MDFSTVANKHKKEVDQRRREAKRKLEERRQNEAIQTTMEEEHRRREEERLREAEEERQRMEEEATLNDGVRYRARLRPYPSARTDDKLELPASALEELDRQGAISAGELLTFRVSVPNTAGVDSSLPGRTHAGVAEFTAEEGTVGVPPRVALCLTKGAGLESLAAVPLVEVRFVRLPRSAKSLVKFQPRGEGFHKNGAAVVNIDLEHVLLETLRGHTALTQGDWLPLRHDGTTFELVVKELEPETQLALLNTDLTVEVLPSEKTEADILAEQRRREAEEAAKRAAEEKERLRLERCQQKAAALEPEPAADPASAVQLMVRLPDGQRLSRRFARTSRFRGALDWVESEPGAFVEPDAFRLVQKWPGHCRELGTAEAEETLQALGFARQEALFLQRLGGEVAEEKELVAADAGGPAGMEVDEASKPTPSHPSRPAALDSAAKDWAAAEEQAHKMLDRRLDGEQDTPTGAIGKEAELGELRGQELVAVFERLVAFGMKPPEAANASKRYAAQLKELGEMGFDDWPEAVRLLEKLLRVANLLSEQAADRSFEPFPQASAPTPAFSSTAPSPAPSPAPPAAPAATAAAPAPAKDSGAGLPKERVAAKFKELITGGMKPAEAAQAAIKQVRDEVNAEAAAATASATTEPVHEQADVADRLKDLAAMGFVDEVRNRELIQKYAGRMERVVEALCSGA
eukprot:TRINITY_DN38297_c0_g1_i2.p1 TRINITY_DN38297_c0_g1~~TRINITY_DN38297_c0_g1_i2.p1  ORF type:complete len:691 (+),score=223.95 TRINITY_DN38297_c0_g1_i2:133-2205(+)